MRNWLIIVGREYKTRVRRRAFIISTLLGPVLMVGFIALMVFLSKSQETDAKILVLDSLEILSYPTSDGHETYYPRFFPQREGHEYTFATIDESIADSLVHVGDYTGYILFDEGVFQHAKVQFHYLKIPTNKQESLIEKDFTKAIEKLRSDAAGLDIEAYRRIKVNVSLNLRSIEDPNADMIKEKSLVGWVFSMFMFMFIMIYGMHVMRGVIEEKSNRIVEVVVSIVKPEALMGAKIAGIGLVGITQIIAWAFLSWILFLIFGAYAEHSGLLLDLMAESGKTVAATDLNTFMKTNPDLGLKFLTEIPWLKMLGWGIFFYIGGFALYGSLFAAVGSSVEQEADAQYLLLPVMLPLTFSYLLNIQILDSPDSTLATVCSFVPFTSPITMMIQISMDGDDVIWTVVSAIILIITVILMIKLSGRIYRTGIFMYGKKPSLLEMLKWLRYRNR